MLLLNPLPQRLDSGATPTFAGLLAGDGTAAAPSISFAADSDTGFYRHSANIIGVAAGGNASLRFGYGGGGYIQGGGSNATILFAAAGGIEVAASGTDQNITLTPSGAGYVSVSDANWDISSAMFSMEVKSSATVASGRGGSIGLGGFYNGSTQVTLAGIAGQKESAVSGETGGMFTVHTRANGGPMVERARILSNGRFLLGTTTDSGALLQIGTNTTTSAGGMVFGTDTFLHRLTTGQLSLDYGAANAQYLKFSQSGVVQASIGHQNGVVYLDTTVAGSSIQFRTGVTTTALTLDASQNATFASHVATAAAGSFGFIGRGGIYSSSDGVFRLANNAGTDFTRLQFGGTTASFPALQRSGANLQVVDAASSGYTTVLALNFWATGPAVTVSAGNVSYGGTTATTVGAAGGASALPATPTGYIIVNVAGTQMKVPYYAN
jgi:hypothetical protein